SPALSFSGAPLSAGLVGVAFGLSQPTVPVRAVAAMKAARTRPISFFTVIILSKRRKLYSRCSCNGLAMYATGLAELGETCQLVRVALSLVRFGSCARSVG